MSQQPTIREALWKLLQTEGRNPDFVAGSLRDLCPDRKAEANALGEAYRNGIPSWLTPPIGTDQIRRATDHLMHHTGRSREQCLWAVETWAFGLALLPFSSLTTPDAMPAVPGDPGQSSFSQGNRVTVKTSPEVTGPIHTGPTQQNHMHTGGSQTGQTHQAGHTQQVTQTTTGASHRTVSRGLSPGMMLALFVGAFLLGFGLIGIGIAIVNVTSPSRPAVPTQPASR